MPEKYIQSGWRLEELIGSFDESEINDALAAVTESAGKIEALRDKLSPDMSEDAFRSGLALLEEFTHRAMHLHASTALWFSADTQNQEALALLGRVEQALTETNNRIMFFSLWWRKLDSENARRLMDVSGDLRYYLYQQRLFSDHTLTEPEEKIISIKDVNGVGALATIYDIITNKFVFSVEIDGERKEMSRDELAVYVRHSLPEVREAAYREQYRVFGAETTVLGQIYINTVRDGQSENMGLRSFKAPISVRNLSNDIPDDVVDTLLDVCSEKAHVFRDYFKMKAERIGSDKLRRFDLYAPVSSAKQEDIPFNDAVTMVMESFNAFSPEFASLAKRVLDEGHIDSEIRPGKRGGAFCFSVTPELAPWVLVNYTGEPRQVATLAHELGHAVHSMLARDHSILTFHAPLPLAETASVFAEMLLTDRLLSEVKEDTARQDILFETIDNIYATVLRQAFFVLFEREAHEAVKEGKTIDQLSEMYLENLKIQFGDAVDIDPVFSREWISIPHIFHTPFYCYAYSFGMLLSLSLYKRYKEEGAAFAPVMIQILSHGGSMKPADILKEAGIEMADQAFWRGGFRVIEDMVGKLEVK
ncbi:MAG: M3 family oligoendopeptidase [Thermodesulfovibrionales bacterium]|nr:M3 family oligoendopeptidase [Thermodesulfovibrionales bacterium]